tara:strand:+ start:270 stop:461 length:192 start_codon:yes stop_codon:yes gene_type:complete
MIAIICDKFSFLPMKAGKNGDFDAQGEQTLSGTQQNCLWLENKRDMLSPRFLCFTGQKYSPSG